MALYSLEDGEEVLKMSRRKKCLLEKLVNFELICILFSKALMSLLNNTNCKTFSGMVARNIMRMIMK